MFFNHSYSFRAFISWYNMIIYGERMKINIKFT